MPASGIIAFTDETTKKKHPEKAPDARNVESLFLQRTYSTSYQSGKKQSILLLFFFL
jgi:hypothetical protein